MDNAEFLYRNEDYVQNIAVDLVAGKHFAAEHGEANKNHVVINEEALKSFDFASAFDAIGEELIYQPDHDILYLALHSIFSSAPADVI